jgi:hypothetical protein
VLLVEADAVLIIIYIRGVLQKPGFSMNGNGNHPVVLTGGMIQATGVALVFLAKLATGIVGRRQISSGGNVLGILFRLG